MQCSSTEKLYEPSPPLWKSWRLLLIRCFYCLESGIVTGHCYDIPLHSFSVMDRFTPDSAFQSALLHISIPNTSNLSTPVIGSYEFRCIPPGIIVQYWTTMPFTSGHFWTLYKAVHTQNHSCRVRRFWKHCIVLVPVIVLCILICTCTQV